MPATAEPPLYFDGHEEPEDGLREHARKNALLIRELLNGKSNNALVSVTLIANSTETEITRSRVCCDTVVTASPKSASAAAALASGALWFETTHGKVTIHHDSQPDTDRTFGLVLVG